MRRRHPNTIAEGLLSLGYQARDFLPAYPGYDEAQIEQLWLDIGLSQDRPVLPYGLLGIRPCRTAHFSYTEHGFRGNGTAQPWPPSTTRPFVACLGGSSTLGFNVSDSDTVPAALGRALAADGIAAEIYNFGSNSWTLRQEAMALLDLLDRGVRPDFVVFLDGFNDSQYAFGNPGLVSLLDTLYRSEKARRGRSLAGAIWDYARTAHRERNSPIPDAFSWTLPEEYRRYADYLGPDFIAAALTGTHPDGASDTDLSIARLVWDRYLDSMALIDGLCRRNAIAALFYWQPVSLYHTRPDQRLGDRLFEVFRTRCCSPPGGDPNLVGAIRSSAPASRPPDTSHRPGRRRSA